MGFKDLFFNKDPFADDEKTNKTEPQSKSVAPEIQTKGVNKTGTTNVIPSEYKSQAPIDIKVPISEVKLPKPTTQVYSGGLNQKI